MGVKTAVIKRKEYYMHPTQPKYDVLANSIAKTIREDREIIKILSNALAIIRNDALNGGSASNMQKTAENALEKYRAYYYDL